MTSTYREHKSLYFKKKKTEAVQLCCIIWHTWRDLHNTHYKITGSWHFSPLLLCLLHTMFSPHRPSTSVLYLLWNKMFLFVSVANRQTDANPVTLLFDIRKQRGEQGQTEESLSGTKWMECRVYEAVIIMCVLRDTHSFNAFLYFRQKLVHFAKRLLFFFTGKAKWVIAHCFHTYEMPFMNPSYKPV